MTAMGVRQVAQRASVGVAGPARIPAALPFTAGCALRLRLGRALWVHGYKAGQPRQAC
jgi:hypothetical protein